MDETDVLVSNDLDLINVSEARKIISQCLLIISFIEIAKTANNIALV